MIKPMRMISAAVSTSASCRNHAMVFMSALAEISVRMRSDVR